MVSRALKELLSCREVIVHTGQHYDTGMSAIFFSELGVPQPDYNLGIGSGTHGQQTGRMLVAVEEVLTAEQPDCTLVYGDTNSTLAGALAAAKLCIPVVHIESGLRSFNRSMPEETNRILTDHVADILFAPTRGAVENLLREGIAERRVRAVGDVMYDAALYYGNRAMAESNILQIVGLSRNSYVLCTIHRAENTEEALRLRSIIDGLGQVAQSLPVVMPLHPRTRKALDRQNLLSPRVPGLLMIEPLGYLDMVMLEKNARVIATDSGGVQKEAFFHRIPCVTLRAQTEWTELVELGWNRLSPPENAATIFDAITRSLDSVGADAFPYGSGDSATKIAQTMALEFNSSS